MEIESQINSLNTINKPELSDNYLLKQRIIFYFSVNGLILTAFLIDYKYLRYHFMNKRDIENHLYLAIALLILTVCCYFKASLTSCGISDANIYFYNNTNYNKSITNISAADYTNCEFCHKKKFIRSSHCRKCKVCVLRRDHHCVWIANCVGHGNNRYFFSFCFWVSLGLLEYTYDAVMFYWSYGQIIENWKELKTGYVLGSFLFVISFFFFTTFLGVASILLMQFHYTFNDLTYLERNKCMFTEMHFPLWVNKNNEKSWNNAYNKGFLANVYYVLGPTIFHGLLPIPSYDKYALQENSNLFKFVKQPHPFEVHGHLRKINYPSIKEIWEEQLETMDPKNYLELALKNYSDQILVEDKLGN